MASTEVSAGTIHYEETGHGPPLVMVGGLAMDGRLWERVAAELAPAHRCLMPTMPLGSHPEPMRRRRRSLAARDGADHRRVHREPRARRT